MAGGLFMKGLLFLSMCLLSLSASASLDLSQTEIIGLKTYSGKTFSNLNLHEGSKVLESLKTDSNIELRDEVIYPEEVSEVISRKLTKIIFTEKRPNQSDYN